MLYFGNASQDQVRETGWFIGQFVEPALGARHQTDVEVKWGVHPDGERRVAPWAHGVATTISVLVQGCLALTFFQDGAPIPMTLKQPGDYVIFGPDVVHTWEASGETIVLSIRFPSREVHQTGQQA